MKTFNSCNRVWLTMPEDGKMPLGLDGKKARELFHREQLGLVPYGDACYGVCKVFWNDPFVKGWYPVHADGTDDHGTAELFITESQFTPRPPRKREIRRRFKLSTKRSILPP